MKNILLVDDEAAVLRYLSDYLSQWDAEFNVLTAANGQEAVTVLAAENVDLVVTDLNMPFMDGFELLAHMREHYPEVPAIVQTASSSVEHKRMDMFESVRVLQKPVESKALVHEVRTALEKASQGHIRGISLFSFLQLMEWERKTAALVVKTKARVGRLYFSSGELTGAHYQGRRGEAAAYAILSWEDVDIQMERFADDSERTITKPLQQILFDAMRLKDEGAELGVADSKTPEETELEEEEMFFRRKKKEVEDAYAGSEISAADEALAAATVLWETEAQASRPEDSGDIFTADVNQGFNSPKEAIMANVKQTLESTLSSIDGAMAAALVDYKSGMALGTAGTGLNLEVAAAGNTEVVRAKMKTMQSLGLKGEIEDILITLDKQYHLIRLLPGQTMFMYLVLNKEQANLAMARYKLNGLTSELTV